MLRSTLLREVEQVFWSHFLFQLKGEAPGTFHLNIVELIFFAEALLLEAKSWEVLSNLKANAG